MKEGQSPITWILAGALVVALLVIAFLVGRQTKVESVGGPVAIVQRVVPAESPSGEPAAAPVPRAQESDDVVITNRGDGEVRIERPDEAPSRSAPRSVGSKTNAVSDYFASIDEIQAGPEGMSPRGFAQGLAADIGSGNSDGLDRLGADLSRAIGELEATKPPPECAAYHTVLLETARDSRRMLGTMVEAMNGGGGLDTIAGQAATLQSRQSKLEKMRKQILDE